MSALAAHVVVRRAAFTVDVAVEVGAGETVAVMGPSGAGKSTLLAAIAGLVRLDGGEVAFDGSPVERTARPRVRVAPMKRGIMMLGQDARLFPHLSARENVAFGPRAAGMPVERARKEADEWLWRVGLPGSGDRMPAKLSGGEQQRVAIARALAASPRAVLLDEPLVALDPETASGIRAMLREQLTGVTTLAVTHDAVDAVALAERLVVIERGAVVQEGPVRDVLASPGSSFVASVAGLNRLVGVAASGGWEKDGMRLEGLRPFAADGALAAVFRPGDVRLAPAASRTWTGALRLEGDRAPNEWLARVEMLEPTPAGVRVRTDRGSVDLDIVGATDLAPGVPVVLSLDPAKVRFQPV